MGYDAMVERAAQPALVDIHASPEARPAIETALRATLPDGPVVTICSGTEIIYRLGPSQWLVRASIDREQSLLEALEKATHNCHAMATLVTDAFATFRVAGPEARTVLCQGVAIDLSPAVFGVGSATRCGFAKTSAILHCVDETPGYDLLVDSSFERYASRWLRSAAGEPVVL